MFITWQMKSRVNHLVCGLQTRANWIKVSLQPRQLITFSNFFSLKLLLLWTTSKNENHRIVYCLFLPGVFVSLKRWTDLVLLPVGAWTHATTSPDIRPISTNFVNAPLTQKPESNTGYLHLFAAGNILSKERTFNQSMIFLLHVSPSSHLSTV